MGTEGFRGGLEELRGLAEREAEKEGEGGKEGEGAGRVAVMCSETLWWRCHRRMVADALVVGGWEVRHLGVGREAEGVRHGVWDIARVEEGGGLVYDGGEGKG